MWGIESLRLRLRPNILYIVGEPVITFPQLFLVFRPTRWRVQASVIHDDLVRVYSLWKTNKKHIFKVVDFQLLIIFSSQVCNNFHTIGNWINQIDDDDDDDDNDNDRFVRFSRLCLRNTNSQRWQLWPTEYV